MSNGWNIEELLQGVAAGRVGIEEQRSVSARCPSVSHLA